MREIRVLGSGNFGVVHLAEDPANKKQYVVKEVFTQGKSEKIRQFLEKEPE